MWKDIKDYEHLYQVNELGQIRSLPKLTRKGTRILNPSIDSYGYNVVSLNKDGKQRTYKVHRLIAQTFINNPDNLPTVDHIDRNPLNNHINNLRWASVDTQLENSRNAKRPVTNGVLIFDSAMDAKRSLGIDNSLIHKSCKSDYKTAGGFKWEYVI